jgi:DNA-binding helix-turn-helix protein
LGYVSYPIHLQAKIYQGCYKKSIASQVIQGEKNMDYLQNMIDIRKEAGITQKELAERIGWSRPQIQRYETRKSIPSIEYLIAFCSYFKVSPNRVLGLPKTYE